MDNRLIVAADTTVVMAIGLIQFSGAAQERSSQTAAQATGRSGMPDMMKMHDQMLADMKAADGRLDALVKDMNAASGDVRITAIAAVVTELAAQHKSMHQRMGQMHQQMMSGRGMMMMNR